MIWNREEIVGLLKELFSPLYRRRLRLTCLSNSENLFEFSGYNQEVVIKTQNPKKKADVLECLDLSGLSILNTTFLPPEMRTSFESRSTENEDWSEWFLKISKAEETYFVPDTNMLYRHYCSKTLFRKLGKEKSSLMAFKIPRLDILEIERKVNQSKKGSKEKRIGLFAMKEIMLLKDVGARLLDPFDISLLIGFSEKAGTKFVDAWIRREIHDYVNRRPPFKLEKGKIEGSPEVLFLTCDLMNSFAAQAEGLRTCYFSKIAKQRYFAESYEELANLIISSSVVFGKIRMDVYDHDKKSSSHQFEGMWSGKTPYHWANDCLRRTS